MEAYFIESCWKKFRFEYFIPGMTLSNKYVKFKRENRHSRMNFEIRKFMVKVHVVADKTFSIKLIPGSTSALWH